MSDIKSIILDILPLAERLEEKLQEFLPDYPVGWYLPNQEEAVIVPGKYYYVYRNRGGVVAYREDAGDVRELNEDVYDDNGELVLRATKNPKETFKRFLTDRPTLPVHGLQIITSLMAAQIYRLLAYRELDGLPIVSDEEVVINAMNGEYSRSRRLSVEMREWLNDLLREIRTDVVAFIKHHDWAEYQINRNAGNLIIIRGMDWRVRDWYRQIGSKLPNYRAYIPS